MHSFNLNSNSYPTRMFGTTFLPGWSCTSSVADQGFPRGVGANSPGWGVGGGATCDFAKISQKLHEIERIWTPREAPVPRARLRSATDLDGIALFFF